MQPQRATSNRRILVVDDEEGVRSALDRVLRRVGYDTVTADSAETALEALRAERFSLVLTDLRMPGIGGHGLIREVSHLAPQMPVMVMSGNGDMEDVIECLRHGVVDFVVKPFVNAELSAAIERAIQRGPRTGNGASAPTPTVVTPPEPEPVVGRLQVVPFKPARIAGGSGVTPVPAPEPPPSPTPAPIEEPAEPPDPLTQVLSRLRTGELPLPVLSPEALSVRELMADEDGTAAKMRAFLEGDPSFAARVVQLTHTPLYSGEGRATTLREAIAKVGFREIGQLVGTLLVHRFHAVGDPGLQPTASASWSHSWSRAVAMRLLAAAEPNLGIPPEEAFAIGMFCDIGRPFLLRVLKGISPIPHEKVDRFVEAHHASVGAAILESWSVPYGAPEIARGHHDTSGLMGNKVLQLLWAVEPLCLAAGTAGEDLDPLLVSRCRHALALSPKLLRHAQATLVEVLEQSEGVFGG